MLCSLRIFMFFARMVFAAKMHCAMCIQKIHFSHLLFRFAITGFFRRLLRHEGHVLDVQRHSAGGVASPRMGLAAPLDRANFTGLVPGCVEAKFCKYKIVNTNVKIDRSNGWT